MAIELITEVANSHQGSVSILKEIIRKFYKVGAKSIKFHISEISTFLKFHKCIRFITRNESLKLIKTVKCHIPEVS